MSATPKNIDAVQIVSDIYLLCLFRPPDPSGLQYYADRIAKGEDVYQIMSEICSSAEALEKRSKIAKISTLSELLVLLKSTPVFPHIYNAIIEKTFTTNEYYNDKVTVSVKLGGNDLVITTYAVNVEGNGKKIVVFNKDLGIYLASRGIKTTDNYIDDEKYDNCYIVGPELLDNPGTIVKYLKTKCNKVVAYTTLKGYCKALSRYSVECENV